ncbi:delta-1-pyrroline-5-carboxylate dehydrogenase Put2 [Schizosaccharomyces pombe]|uniref:Probable delta-1-pyrroline-5-carboxylate dehydrogenase n=1 Tax=Schizosaccharomyces pombe (strain 972 / ATCC 24843) TaxID=284812 RepID=PUT2_SCHPO|nr:putative delta-1-pyrroline-5-carboxylate dehydrogenase [Schizosaccharomyces pombe]O74766.1 RecName: Full=Probable delta-1-pyrroline-5-carboxylate dehydrogenase; Short=P5C dehydrogenase; AltName: Full=L-glutamate gamma-semialdehyde dehydrogenase [Schizosaccharomyces pombe 972h-]CAA21148.1 delta-1-pyrroline-5-carboxylate dehydrogenase (predicted) [Schizosaccharomyces pombe]|eukprot:NP_001342759.1 putative delta-1-pyrroline-5-carboxylate dehydrogenase [Schizosaccharomyces pombe]
MSQFAEFKLPAIKNEPPKHYGPNSADREGIVKAYKELEAELPVTIPVIIDGKEVETNTIGEQRCPFEHKKVVARYHRAGAKHVEDAIEAALRGKKVWESLPFADRSAIFLKAAHLISTKYRYKLMAATMIGQGKNIWQAEIDAGMEIIDFLRFNTKYASELYASQPPENTPGVWNRMEYRPLEGFVYAITPFNFTAIAGNLAAAPLLMGNVVLMKPSDHAVLSSYIVYQIFREAGLPAGALQFIPGDAVEVSKVCFNHPEFAGLHFTGSTAVFRSLWGTIGENVANGKYRTYPKIVGETGGKNFHLVHSSAEIKSAVVNAVRAAFEYQGQKCSALSRLYVSKYAWENGFRDELTKQVKSLKVGAPLTDFANFVGPVIHQASFNKLKKVLESAASDSEIEVLAGGKADDSEGFFVEPTVLLSKNPKHDIFVNELFGPVLSVYVYEDDNLDAVCDLIDTTTPYGLTGSIFAQDRVVVRKLTDRLRNAAGNFYINDKCTGAVVGEQPFGGARASGTNDKAGSGMILSRFVSPRSIKDTFAYADSVLYPSNF